MLPRLTPRLAIALVALAQTLVLVWMVVDRTILLKTGREIVLPIQPVDPRDPFRGQFVRLGYSISQIPLTLVEGPRPGRNAAFYVTIERLEDGSWRSVRLTRDLPARVEGKQIVLKARAYRGFPTDAPSTAFVAVRYGIESFFVSEAQAPKLESMARDRKLEALVAVDSKGNAAIKGLVIDGQLQYSEPLL